MNFNPLTWDAPYLVIVGALFMIVFLRANGTYWLGRLISRGAERTRARRMMETPGYQRAVQRLNQWGPPVVSVSFLTIGFQTMVNLAAGVTRMPLRRYLPAVTVGCIIWAFMYSTVGFIGWAAVVKLWEISPLAVLALAVVLSVGIGIALARRDRAVVAPAE